MFTTDLSARVLLTVLLLGPIGGLCHLNTDQNINNWTRTRETKSDESESRLLSSIEEPGILLPPDDKYNFVGEDSQTTQGSSWRTARGSPVPSTTIVSTNSFSIRPGGTSSSSLGSGSGSSVFINAKPLTIVATGGSGYKGQPQSPYPSSPKGYYDSVHSKNDKSTVYVKNNCYGSRCPTSSNKQDYGDDNKSYHYILNKDVKQKLRRNDDNPVRRNGETGDFPVEHHMTLSLPFRVEPAISQSDLKYPYRFPNQNRNNRRVSRTTTTTPGWIKLQPILPEQYDLFSINTTRKSHPEKSEMSQNSQFSNRLGIELNPESFADRWGWGSDSYQSHKDKGSGSRLPSWLQEIHSTLQGGPTRDSDNKNWVKLDPIPVAGVSISKWVPKGTPSSELPSTNWPTRDHRPNGGNFGNNANTNANNYNNNQWYDHLNNINKLSRPTYIPIPVQLESNHGWGPNRNQIQHQPQSSSYDRNPTNQWNDVIYPEGPSSATASWQQDKDLSKYSSSFPISTPSSSSSGWPSDNRRPPSIPGSWSADRDRGPQFINPPFGGGNRRHGSNSYPDRSNSDDSRWVLVSNSRKVSVSPSESQRHPPSHEYNGGQKYRPDFDKFSDFPFYYENPYRGGHRVGKNVRSSLKRAISSSNQDDAFYKVNATLAGLAPVLSGRGSSQRPPDVNTLRSSSSTTTKRPTTKSPKRKLPAFMKPYAGDGRAVSSGSKNNQTYDQYDYDDEDIRSTTPALKGRKGMKINPVYAAVGAGMIPATMAAVLPMVLGRKRRDVGPKPYSYYLPNPETYSPNQPRAVLQPPATFLDHETPYFAKSPYVISKSTFHSSNSMKARGKYLYQT